MLVETALLKLTLKCNLDCNFCYQDNDTNKELTYDEIKSVIDKLGKAGCKVLLISGGEPLIRMDLEDIVRCAKSNGIVTKVATNGFLLDEQRIISLDNSLLDEIHISVSDMGDRVRLEKFIEIKRYADESGINFTKLGVNIITTKSFIDNMDTYLNWLWKTGIEIIELIPPRPGREKDWYNNERMDITHYFKLCREILRWEDKFKIRMHCSLFLINQILYNKKSDYHCNVTDKSILIYSSGQIYPCTCFNDSEYCGGNIIYENLDDLENSPGFKKFKDRYGVRSLNSPCNFLLTRKN